MACPRQESDKENAWAPAWLPSHSCAMPATSLRALHSGALLRMEWQLRSSRPQFILKVCCRFSTCAALACVFRKRAVLIAAAMSPQIHPHNPQNLHSSRHCSMGRMWLCCCSSMLHTAISEPPAQNCSQHSRGVRPSRRHGAQPTQVAH